MSSDAVGFWFALVVLGWATWPHLRAYRVKKAAARAECAARGHDYGDEFTAMGGRFKNCKRCHHQSHYVKDTDTWL